MYALEMMFEEPVSFETTVLVMFEETFLAAVLEPESAATFALSAIFDLASTVSVWPFPMANKSAAMFLAHRH
jgi:hypothetical protein